MRPPASRSLRLLPLLVFFVLLGAASSQAQTASQLYAQGVQAYNQGDVEQAKRQLQLTLEVDKNFRPASALLNRIAQEQRVAGGAAPAAVVPTRSLERMVVPVEFRDTSLQSALEYIRQHIEGSTSGKTTVNFVLNVPPELANKKVTLQLDHVPVTELLRYIGELAGVSIQIQKYAILVTPAPGNTAPQTGGAAGPVPAASTP